MSHLSLEILARLVDEAPSRDEAAHLDTCEMCRTELDAMREDVQSLGMLPVVAPARDAWPELERRLTDEGLIRKRRGAAGWPRLLQMAAAVVLFLAGSLAGRMIAAPQPAMTTAGATSAPTDVQPATGTAPVTTLADGTDENVRSGADDEPAVYGEPAVESRANTARPQTGLRSSSRLAASGFTGGGPVTIEEAGALLRETEQLYLSALTRYAELATQTDPGDPVARLAALQSIVMTTQAALDQAPADPVINGVHLATLAQRDATLAQVAAVSGERWYD